MAQSPSSAWLWFSRGLTFALELDLLGMLQEIQIHEKLTSKQVAQVQKEIDMYKALKHRCVQQLSGAGEGVQRARHSAMKQWAWTPSAL